MKPKKQSRSEFWRTQVRESDDFSGNATEFCRQRGLNLGPFYSWRKRVRSEQGQANISSRFVPVEVLLGEPARQLPDPKWLAELIHFLARGVRP
jgi:hypothetical protein